MSPASYLTAPPRGVCPDCSTLVTLVSMWDWAIWAALVLGLDEADDTVGRATANLPHK
jgi:hypothetical protein